MLEAMNAAAISALLPARPEEGHKGIFGHLFVLAGSRGFTGAARLVCESACRSGAGLVTLGVPKPLADIFAVSLRETMTLVLPATEAQSLAHAGLAQALAFARGRDAVALGSGLSLHPETALFAREMAESCPVPMVVDADGLNALALAGAFDCGVNELPLSFVLSWYEQKAVVILLTLLHLGIKNMRIGPSLPAFIGPNVLNVLVEKFGLTPISTPEADLAAMLG